MEILILNGSPDAGLDKYLEELSAKLEQGGHQVAELRLRSLALRHCIGCFGCWVRTPGQCTFDDDGRVIARRVMAADLVIVASPILMGHVSALIRRANERLLPLLLPYARLVDGESRHHQRYPRRPRLGLLLAPADGSDDEDVAIIRQTYQMNTRNFATELAFTLTTSTATEEVAQEIERAEANSSEGVADNPLPTRGLEFASAHRKLLLLNGSPRPKSNTRVLLGHFVAGMGPGHQIDEVSLRRCGEQGFPLEQLTAADAVILAFPLYCDAMPSVVKDFFEQLAPLCARERNPPMGFIVQSGFPEAFHSRAVERYLQKLAGRLHSPYLGTVVRGGVEGIQVMPAAMTRTLFRRFEELGRRFGETGRLDPALIRQLAGTERFSWSGRLVFRLLGALGLTRWYWDTQLKKNGAYERRFARPYLPARDAGAAGVLTAPDPSARVSSDAGPALL